MGSLTADEIAAQNMHPTWAALDAVSTHHAMLRKFLLEELPPDAKFNPDGMTTALALCAEFDVICPRRLPSVWELVVADRAGKLTEKIRELNAAFAAESKVT